MGRCQFDHTFKTCVWRILCSSFYKLKENCILCYQRKLVYWEDLEMEENVENNPQVNTRAVSICTYAYTGRSQALSKTTHK